MDRNGAFQYELPDAGYPDRTKIGQGPSWGDVVNFATDHRTLKELNPGTMFGRALQGVGNVARGEGDASDAINIGSALAEVTPLGKLGAIGAGAFKAMAMLPKAGKAVDSALDMSQAARMARAKEMGFDTKTPMYSGRYQDFEAFDPERTSYFTPDPEYASQYTNPSASSLGKSSNHFKDPQPNVVKAFLNDKDVFDTRNPDHLDIFNKEFLNKYGNGTPLTERGLPDWTDAEPFREFVEDKRHPFTGVIVDEGSTPMPDGSIKHRGASIAMFDPTKIRSVNAAFDPAKKNRSDLLASAVPGAVVAGGALGAFGLQPLTDEEFY